MSIARRACSDCASEPPEIVEGIWSSRILHVSTKIESKPEIQAGWGLARCIRLAITHAYNTEGAYK